MVSIEDLKIVKYHTFLKKNFFFVLVGVSVAMEMKKIFKEEESVEILKFLV